MKTSYLKSMLTIFGGALLLCAMKAHAVPARNVPSVPAKVVQSFKVFKMAQAQNIGAEY